MKFAFLTGGIAGFVAAGGTDLLCGRNPNRILFDAAVGCLAGAFLFRWFWNVLLRGMRDTYMDRQRAAAAAPAPAPAVPTPAARLKPKT
ncbi:MAG: hypothetical protein ACREFX_02825 [Opitutaceae bacterium]